MSTIDDRRSLDPAALDSLATELTSSVARTLADEGRRSGASPLTRADPAAEARAHKVMVDAIAGAVRRLLSEGQHITEADEDDLLERIRGQLFGLGELDRLVRDDSVENVFANGADQVWVSRADGTRERVRPIAATDEALTELIRQAAARDGRSERRFDRAVPWVSFRLSDGSRLTAVQDISGRTVFALRRHRHTDTDLADLRREPAGTVGRTLEQLLGAMVRARFNLLVVGGTDAGKTTLLRALINAIAPSERLVTVEDALELQLSRHPDRHPNVVELESRDANIEGQGEVTLRDLTRLALRLSPDRVIVGEARGPEILDMFSAMSQGNDGSMGTLHARSSGDAFVQITRYALKAPEHLTPEAVAVDIAASLDFVVHIHKLKNGRRVISSVREITGFDGAQVHSNEVFAPDNLGRADFRIPFQDRSLERLIDAGFDPALLDLPGGGWDW